MNGGDLAFQIAKGLNTQTRRPDREAVCAKCGHKRLWHRPDCAHVGDGPKGYCPCKVFVEARANHSTDSRRAVTDSSGREG